MPILSLRKVSSQSGPRHPEPIPCNPLFRPPDRFLRDVDRVISAPDDHTLLPEIVKLPDK
jgi:hypothetical protein